MASLTSASRGTSSTLSAMWLLIVSLNGSQSACRYCVSRSALDGGDLNWLSWLGLFAWLKWIVVPCEVDCWGDYCPTGPMTTSATSIVYRLLLPDEGSRTTSIEPCFTGLDKPALYSWLLPVVIVGATIAFFLAVYLGFCRLPCFSDYCFLTWNRSNFLLSDGVYPVDCTFAIYSSSIFRFLLCSSNCYY